MEPIIAPFFYKFYYNSEKKHCFNVTSRNILKNYNPECSRLKSKIKDLSSRCKCCRHNKQKDGLCEKDSKVLEIGQKAKEMKSEDISSSFVSVFS